jgi:hypothetical protein
MIREILDKLPKGEYNQLMLAFENEFEQYIELPDNKFVGVNVGPVQHLIITESAGQWAYGNIKKGNK